MTENEILEMEEISSDEIAEFYAEELTELSKIPNRQHLTIDNQELGELQSDLSNWEVQVFEFEESLFKYNLR